mgnify:FL=1
MIYIHKLIVLLIFHNGLLTGKISGCRFQFNPVIMIVCRGGTGMETQIQVGHWVSNILQVRVWSGTGLRKTLPETTCISGKVIHRHKSF